MSRIGNKFILIPELVNIIFDNNILLISGPKGNVKYLVPSFIKLIIKDKKIFLSLKNQNTSNALLGTCRVLINNHIIGVVSFFKKKLILKGVGYKVNIEKKGIQNIINMYLGYSHVVKYIVPKNIEINIIKNIEILITGIDKQLVGQVAADIRMKKKPESYKNKGIYYSDEKVILKEAKKK